VRHFYHVWADGAWQAPLAEHVAAMKASGLPAVLEAGIIGSPENRAAVRSALDSTGVKWTLAVSADAGFEGVTLTALHTAAAGDDGPFLYAHTKGASQDDEFHARWRRGTTSVVVGRWRECVQALSCSDLAGAHWLAAGLQFSTGFVTIDVPESHFGGNFWWGNGAYLCALPVPPMTQFEAETWVGQNNPQVADLSPGMPGRIYT
jgi:hypothetical protein